MHRQAASDGNKIGASEIAIPTHWAMPLELPSPDAYLKARAALRAVVGSVALRRPSSTCWVIILLCSY